jgi:hypothetical protein
MKPTALGAPKGRSSCALGRAQFESPRLAAMAVGQPGTEDEDDGDDPHENLMRIIEGWIAADEAERREKEKLSSVSSAFDLNSRVAEVTVCGMSSSLRQVTVVPAYRVGSGTCVTRVGTLIVMAVIANGMKPAQMGCH